MVRVTDSPEAGVEFRRDAAGDGAETLRGWPEREGGV